jgi:hypothetical protein
VSRSQKAPWLFEKNDEKYLVFDIFLYFTGKFISFDINSDLKYDYPKGVFAVNEGMVGGCGSRAHYRRIGYFWLPTKS